jgi:hypothetical protein
MRKTRDVQVPALWGGRDAGKWFRLTEMPAAQAEKWAIRAFLALSGSGAQVPLDLADRGMEAIFIIGLNIFFQGQVKFEILEPLLDEMFSCIQIIRAPNVSDKSTGATIAHDIVSQDDIMEIKTRAWLRSEVLNLHTGFSVTDALSSLILAMRAKMQITENAETSPQKSP